MTTPAVPTVREASATQVAILVRDAITRVNRQLRRTRPVGQLTITQISALQSLETAGALTPRELAEIERIQPPTLTRIVAKLEARGLVGRTPHPSDRRQVILAPTAAGIELLVGYRRVRDEWLAHRLSKLDHQELDVVQRAAEILARIAKDTSD